MYVACTFWRVFVFFYKYHNSSSSCYITAHLSRGVNCEAFGIQKLFFVIYLNKTLIFIYRNTMKHQYFFEKFSISCRHRHFGDLTSSHGFNHKRAPPCCDVCRQQRHLKWKSELEIRFNSIEQLRHISSRVWSRSFRKSWNTRRLCGHRWCVFHRLMSLRYM